MEGHVEAKGRDHDATRGFVRSSVQLSPQSFRADDEVGLVEAALEHMRLHHPAAPVEEERVRQIVSTRSYAIEYVAL